MITMFNNEVTNKLIKARGNDQFRFFEQFGLLNDEVYLAGGALRHLFTKKQDEIKDFDLFFKDLGASQKTCRDLEVMGAEVIFQCPEDKLTNFKWTQMTGETLKIQCIKERIYPNLEELINTFDINACRIGYNGNVIVTDLKAIRDIKNKRITLNEIDFPNATFKRLLKYMKKGYSLPNETIDIYMQRIYNKGKNGESLESRFYID